MQYSRLRRAPVGLLKDCQKADRSLALSPQAVRLHAAPLPCLEHWANIHLNRTHHEQQILQSDILDDARLLQVQVVQCQEQLLEEPPAAMQETHI